MSYKHTRGAKLNTRCKLSVVLISLMLVCGGVLTAIHMYHPPVHNPTKAVVSPTSVSKPGINYALPVRLQIPKLNIDAHVIYVGLTKDGNMSVPTNITDVGWYKYGALPGNMGTAVIAGHLDGLGGKSGVFMNLDKLTKDDTITVTESNGVTVSFIVRETRSYPQDAQPNEVFNSTSGSHLNLITCTGSWDSSEHQFAKRLVIFADKAPSI